MLECAPPLKSSWGPPACGSLGHKPMGLELLWYHPSSLIFTSGSGREHVKGSCVEQAQSLPKVWNQMRDSGAPKPFWKAGGLRECGGGSSMLRIGQSCQPDSFLTASSRLSHLFCPSLENAILFLSPTPATLLSTSGSQEVFSGGWTIHSHSPLRNLCVSGQESV